MNELEFYKELEKINIKLTNNQKNHITEIGLDNYNNFDYVLKNIKEV